MTFEEAWGAGKHISETIFKEEGEVLYSAVSNLPQDALIVEIGCYVGRSTHIMAVAAKEKEGKVITIDPFLKSFNGWHNSDPKTAFKKNVLDVLSNVTLIEGYSEDVFNKIPDDIDFMFIDGDHSYEGVKRDCDNYLPKLKSGSMVSFHDYHSSFEGVKKAVDEACAGWQVVNNVWSISTRRKP